MNKDGKARDSPCYIRLTMGYLKWVMATVSYGKNANQDKQKCVGFEVPASRTNYHMWSFIPRTLREWNRLLDGPGTDPTSF